MVTRNLAWGVNPNTSKLDSRYDENGDVKVVLLGLGNFTNGVATPQSIYPDTSWTVGNGTPFVENGALRMNYPALVGDPLWEGGIFNSLNFNVNSGQKELYIKFDSKMPNAKHGLKFLKIFGENATGGVNTVANTTFGLDYTGLDYGAMRMVSFGDGTTEVNDTQKVVFLNGMSPSWVGRSWGIGASVVSNGQYFDSADWGTGWHTFRLKIKFNDGTTAGNEVNNGEILVNIDGVDYVHATGLFNRHYTNGNINYLSFGDWTQAPAAGSPAFDIHYDNISISLNGFYEGT